MSLRNHDIAADISSSNEIIESISLLRSSRLHQEYKAMGTNLVFSSLPDLLTPLIFETTRIVLYVRKVRLTG